MEIKNYNFQVQDTISISKTDFNPTQDLKLNSELNIERNTIEMVTLRTFSEDSSLLIQPKKIKPIIKTIPLVPEKDTIGHPIYNVFDGNFNFPTKTSFFDPFYFTPFDPKLKDQQFERNIIQKQDPHLADKKVETITPEKKAFSSKTNSDLSQGFASTDWMLGVIFFSLILFGWLRVGYTRYFQTAVQASINYFTARRIFEEANATRSRVFYFMNLLFFINLALFLTQYFEYHHIYLFELHGILQFFLCFLIIIAFYSTKSIILYLFDYLFLSNNGFASYVFTVFIYNKIVGFLLLPIVTFLPFVPSHITPYMFIAGALIFTILYVFRVFKGLQLCFKNRLSIFYLILYLCALEIMPVLILLKFILV